MEITKEIEEKLRHELSKLPHPRYKKPPIVMDTSAMNLNLKEDESIFNKFTDYLDKLRHEFQVKIPDVSEIDSFVALCPMEGHHVEYEEEVGQRVFDSDSPITMGSSEDGGDLEDDLEEDVFSVVPSSSSSRGHGTKKYKKLTFKDVERSLDFHENEENKYLNELDILITFLKGQNHLYSLSHYLTQQKINMLTIPSFLFSIVVTVLAPLTHAYTWSGILTSALTATIGTLFGCVRYYELDSASSKYLSLTNHYNKMQLFLETISNSLALGTEKIQGAEWKGVVEKIREVEAKMTEIREMNTLLPPEEVKLLIPIISHVNIFSFIKKMKMMKKNKISKFLGIKNEIRFILNQWEEEDLWSDSWLDDATSSSMVGVVGGSAVGAAVSTGSGGSKLGSFVEIMDIGRGGGGGGGGKMGNGGAKWKRKRHQRMREKNRLSYLLKQKSEIRRELNYYRTVYSYMDEIFTREINLADHTSHWWMLFRWFLGIPPDALPKNNPVVDKYLEFISGFGGGSGGGVEISSMKSEQMGGDDFSYLEDDDDMV
jgi:hypothetical protein